MRKCLILKGKTEKAEKILRQSHLEIGNISRDYSDDYPENKIIKTNQNKVKELISMKSRYCAFKRA